jgi:ADP-ribose pyrophosphatase
MAKKKGEEPDAVLEGGVAVAEEAVEQDQPVDEEPAGPDALGEPEDQPEPASDPVTYVPFADQVTPRTVLHSRRSFTGRVWDVTSDLVDLGESGVVTRDYVHHPGAVAIFALNEESQVYLVRQYRHPVRTETWEPPAGLLDVREEDPLPAAKRELLEEADLTAATWHVLVDFFTSPGGSSEGIRIYLARDLAPVPEEERHSREAEERDMVGAWVDVPSILNAINRADVAGPTLLLGAFALDAAMRADFATLRPADAPWRRPPARGEH